MQLDSLCSLMRCVFIFIYLRLFRTWTLPIFIANRGRKLRNCVAAQPLDRTRAGGGPGFGWLRLRAVGHKLAPLLLGGCGFLRLSGLAVIFR
jgi:hypothetical protein